MKDRIDELRAGGATNRYHAAPVAEQTVAAHSWGVAQIIEHVYHPTLPPPSLLLAALFHDVAEHVCGDMPAPVKWANPDLAVRIGELEAQWKRERKVNYESHLTTAEHEVLRHADKLELAYYCLEQYRRGNKEALGPVERVLEWKETRVCPNEAIKLLWITIGCRWTLAVEHEEATGAIE